MPWLLIILPKRIQIMCSYYLYFILYSTNYNLSHFFFIFIKYPKHKKDKKLDISHAIIW